MWKKKNGWLGSMHCTGFYFNLTRIEDTLQTCTYKKLLTTFGWNVMKSNWKPKKKCSSKDSWAYLDGVHIDIYNIKHKEKEE